VNDRVQRSGSADPSGPATPSPSWASVTVVVESDAVITVECVGELDELTHTKLVVALDEAVARRPRKLHVDFGGVSYFNASAINALLSARDAQRLAGHQFGVREASAFGRRLLAFVDCDLVEPSRSLVGEEARDERAVDDAGGSSLQRRAVSVPDRRTY